MITLFIEKIDHIVTMSGKVIMPLLIVVCLAAAVFLSGCTGSSAYVYSGDAESAVTITDSYEREVMIPSEVDSIVCSSGGTCTRYLTYMESSDLFVGVESGEGETDTNRPYVIVNPQFVDLPVVSSKGDGANLEQIMVLNPDVVFMSGSSITNESGETASPADVMQSKTGVPVVAFSSGSFSDEEHLEQMFAGSRVLGQALGKEERAEELIAYIEASKADLLERTADIPESEKKTAYMM